MGWRFRKSFKAGPFRLNYSSKGVGWSVGAGGTRYTHRADGRRTVTSTIKGTGLSYVTDLGKKDPASERPSVSRTSPRFRKTKLFFGWYFILMGICCLTPILAGNVENIQSVSISTVLIAMVVCFVLGFLLLKSARKNHQKNN